MKIIQCAQHSPEWFAARAGIVTASEADNLITPKKLEPKKGAAVESYMAVKLAERWLGGPLMQFGGGVLEQGNILEDEARPWLALQLNREINEVGFILSDDGRSGCSPDGLMADEGAEIKCPQPPAHIGYLLAGTVPEQYLPQIHFSLFVTGFTTWHFLSYRRSFPPLLLRVERDEKIQAVLKEALGAFLEKFDKQWARLCELGTPPKRMTQEEKNAAWERAGQVPPENSLWPRA